MQSLDEIKQFLLWENGKYDTEYFPKIEYVIEYEGFPIKCIHTSRLCSTIGISIFYGIFTCDIMDKVFVVHRSKLNDNIVAYLNVDLNQHKTDIG